VGPSFYDGRCANGYTQLFQGGFPMTDADAPEVSSQGETNEPEPDLARSRRRSALLATSALVVLLVDRLTKWWAETSLDEPQDVVWTLRFSLHENTGAAFSRFTNLGPVIAVLAVVVIVALVRVGRGVQSGVGAVALGSILGGAVGNLVDRVIRADDGLLSGAVIDFIDFQWWPVFNVADMGIVVGGALVLLVSLRGEDSLFGEASDS